MAYRNTKPAKNDFYLVPYKTIYIVNGALFPLMAPKIRVVTWKKSPYKSSMQPHIINTKIAINVKMTIVLKIQISKQQKYNYINTILCNVM